MKALLILLLAVTVSGCAARKKEVTMTRLHDIEVTKISGETVKLESYRGQTLLIVNTASRCGFTGQYAGLQKLHETYHDKGFTVLGFPSNDFMKQEPDSNEEMASFCQVNYGVTFPMFAKIKVKGEEQHPLYIYLTSKETNPEFGGKISWNFNKFLVSGEGEVINRFGSRTKPNDKKLIAAIEGALK